MPHIMDVWESSQNGFSYSVISSVKGSKTARLPVLDWANQTRPSGVTSTASGCEHGVGTRYSVM